MRIRQSLIFIYLLYFRHIKTISYLILSYMHAGCLCPQISWLWPFLCSCAPSPIGADHGKRSSHQSISCYSWVTCTPPQPAWPLTSDWMKDTGSRSFVCLSNLRWLGPVGVLCNCRPVWPGCTLNIRQWKKASSAFQDQHSHAVIHVSAIFFNAFNFKSVLKIWNCRRP